MAYRPYLIQQFENTHENQFFRFFSTKLRNYFNNQTGLHILIGNVSCHGHQIDAIFISIGKIIVIDFKNFGGTLTFSENNPWQISNGNDFVFVAGRNNIRNPFQQIKAYRMSLIQFLDNKRNNLLQQNHDNLNFGHISGMIVFHNTIIFDENQIPARIRSYFDVADNTSFYHKIADRNSPELNLSDIEIENILSNLNVNDENIYRDNIETEIPAYNQEFPHLADNLELVRREIKNINPKTEIEKLLIYYHTLIKIEAKKEPVISQEHKYHIDWNTISDNHLIINIENNPDFHRIYQQNRSQQKPRDLFIGINVSFKEQIFPLLYNHISLNDNIEHTNIECKLDDLKLYSKPLENRDYPDDLIEELNTEINQHNTLNEKLLSLNNYFNGIELKDNIILALIEDNIFSAQLLSELNRIKNQNLISKDSFIEKFISMKEIRTEMKIIPEEDFIQITPLNKKQKEAIQLSFNRPLTVITGPPGTGKSQVVLNILANAILHNKKILFASKNNQAVDCVVERFSQRLQESKYLIRFGKRELNNVTQNNIQTFINRIQNGTMHDNTNELNQIKDKIREYKDLIIIAKRTIKRKQELQRDINKLKIDIHNKEIEYFNWLDGDEKDKINTFCKYPINKLNEYIKPYVELRSQVLFSYKGVRKLFFNFKSKKKFANNLDVLFQNLQIDLLRLAINNDINIKLNELKNGGVIISKLTKLIEFFENGRKLIQKKDKIENEIENISSILTNYQQEFNNIIIIEQEKIIIESQEQIDALGLGLLNELIHHRLKKCDVNAINNFKNNINNNYSINKKQNGSFPVITKEFLNIFNIIAVTSLSIKNSFPLSEGLFDIVVIDEASQCDIASALPLVYRAKQLVVIGDPLQLKHITKVQVYEENYLKNILEIDENLSLNYVEKSLYDYCFNLSIISRVNSIYLNEHFRCHPEIISYSNLAFYGPMMGQELDILTSPENYPIQPKGIFWININGSQHPHRNTNNAEIEESIRLAIEFANKNINASIGIATPFRDQYVQIKQIITNMNIDNQLKNRIKVGTVHNYQGDEKEIMILSLVISSNSPAFKANWINYCVPYLINVAVTRARNTLFIVGNANYSRTLPDGSPLKLLVTYLDRLGHIKNK